MNKLISFQYLLITSSIEIASCVTILVDRLLSLFDKRLRKANVISKVHCPVVVVITSY